jgi:hypothetical protein
MSRPASVRPVAAARAKSISNIHRAFAEASVSRVVVGLAWSTGTVTGGGHWDCGNDRLFQSPDVDAIGDSLL